jgi:hypothetical protein
MTGTDKGAGADDAHVARWRAEADEFDNWLTAESLSNGLDLWLSPQFMSGAVPTAAPEIMRHVNFSRLSQRDRHFDADHWSDQTPTRILPRRYERYLRIMFPLLLRPPRIEPSAWWEGGAETVVANSWKQLADRAEVEHSPTMRFQSFPGDIGGEELHIANQYFLLPHPTARQRLIEHLIRDGDVAVAVVDPHRFGLFCVQGSLEPLLTVAESTGPYDMQVWSGSESWYGFFEDLRVDAWLACTSEVADRLLSDPELECHDIPASTVVFPQVDATEPYPLDHD